MRAAIYSRVSSRQQEDGTSLETQEARCRLYARERGFTVTEPHVFRETYTGELLWERPALTQLREAVRRREVDVVIAFAIDRLSRDPVHLGVILSEADHKGVTIEFVTESLDDSPEGQLILYVRGYAAKVEHEKIKERTMRGKIARVQSGKLLTNGRPLYGYQWRDESKAALDIRDDTAAIVRRIYADIAAGGTLRGLASDLTTAGIPTPTGQSHLWNNATIQSILHNPAYKGQAVGWAWRRPASSDEHGSQWLDWERAIELPPGVVPPIVDPQTWETVQAVLRGNKLRAVRNAREPEAALLRGGYVRCAYCGNSMIARETKGRYEYYCKYGSGALATCPGGPAISARMLDHAVWTAVKVALTQDDVIERALEQHLQGDAPADPRPYERLIADLERQQSALTRRIAVTEDDLLAEPLMVELRAVGERRRRLIAERDHAEQERALRDTAQASLRGFRDWSETYRANLDALSWGEKRVLLDILQVQAIIRRADDPDGKRRVIESVVDLSTSPVNSTTCRTGHRLRIPVQWSDGDLPKPWSLYYPCCVTCGCTDRPHHANGVCATCYRRARRAERRT